MDELRPPPPGSGRADQGGGGDLDEEPGLLGDVVLCPEVAADQAAQARHELRDELELLCTHGILHLLGFDHAEPDEKATMFGLQDRLLDSWRAGRAPGPGAAEPGAVGQAVAGRSVDGRDAAGRDVADRDVADRDVAAPGPAGADARERDEAE
jgi:rRNA maturation RNase YbeY